MSGFHIEQGALVHRAVRNIVEQEYRKKIEEECKAACDEIVAKVIANIVPRFDFKYNSFIGRHDVIVTFRGEPIEGKEAV